MWRWKHFNTCILLFSVRQGFKGDLVVPHQRPTVTCRPPPKAPETHPPRQARWWSRYEERSLWSGKLNRPHDRGKRPPLTRSNWFHRLQTGEQRQGPPEKRMGQRSGRGGQKTVETERGSRRKIETKKTENIPTEERGVMEEKWNQKRSSSCFCDAVSFL